jgi:hypothetical protein
MISTSFNNVMATVKKLQLSCVCLFILEAENLEEKFALFRSRVFIVFDLSLEKRGKNGAAKTGVLQAVKWWVAGIKHK